MNDKPMFDKKLSLKLGTRLSKENARLKYEQTQKKQKTLFARESVADAKIREAMNRGEFNNLSGSGKPLDLSYMDVPEHLRVGYHMLKNSGFLPEEVRLKKEMEDLKQKLSEAKTEEEKKKIMKKLNETSRNFHFCMEYNKSLKQSSR